MNVLRSLPFVFTAGMLIGGVLCAENPAASDAERPVEDAAKFKLSTKANPALPSIYIIGDSTVRVGTAGQRGWGDELGALFDPARINVVNHAIGGRSSRTFITEGRWAASLAQMQKGDFLLIQFGHNDSSAVNDASRARGSLKGTGAATQEIDNMLTRQKEVVHTFGWYLRQYLTEAMAKGVTPVVCSPVPRNSWSKDGKKVNRSGSGSYGGWGREVAREEGAAFIDLNDLIAEGYEKLGRDKVVPMFSMKPDGRGRDGTHTSVEGARFNARCVVAGLCTLPGNPFAKYLLP